MELLQTLTTPTLVPYTCILKTENQVITLLPEKTSNFTYSFDHSFQRKPLYTND